ncbi:MAG: retropepsin-like aspartic protease [Fimbriimonas sp.]
MLLDTGAAITVVHPKVLQLIGCPSIPQGRSLQLTTADSSLTVSLVKIDALTLGDIRAKDFEVAAHPLPPAAGIDGLLGLDFFRDRSLQLDFRTRSIVID